jgi:REP element-mobilizing transposase RayT
MRDGEIVSRQPRRISESGCYHIVFRGVNHCHLFEERSDFEAFLDKLSTLKAEFPFEVYAYCLMSNHVHLLLKENSPGDISSIMRKALTWYAGWFNRKYQRCGALIANRYKSQCIEENSYLLAVVRYIHQNPVVAGASSRIEAYPWSSYGDYIDKPRGHPALTDTRFILAIFSEGAKDVDRAFADFNNTVADGVFLPTDGIRMTEDEVSRMIAETLEDIPTASVASLPKIERNIALAKLRERGFSIRQIERATGVSRGVIAKC